MRKVWENCMVEKPIKPVYALVDVLLSERDSSSTKGVPLDTSMVPDLLVKPSLLPQSLEEPQEPSFFDCLVEVMKRKGSLRNFHKPKLPQKPPSMTFHRYMELLHEFGV